MILFNIVLIFHFVAFLLFLAQLVILLPRQEKQLHKKAIFVGIAIAITGILLVLLIYPQVNFYKVIPKSILFIAIASFCGIYSGKSIPVKIYYLIIAMTLLASLIALVKL